jgi:uncharacterized protein YecE (DUF72 family)
MTRPELGYGPFISHFVERVKLITRYTEQKQAFQHFFGRPQPNMSQYATLYDCDTQTCSRLPEPVGFKMFRARNMKMRIGTSGFGYREWLGDFYPLKLSGAKMLPYYAERIATVEINYTFRRTASVDLLERWSAGTPTHFRFALKAPFQITHSMKLRSTVDAVQAFADRANVLGDRLGPILFQLPPTLKKDTALLDDFLATMPGSIRPAFEFRDASWFDDSVMRSLGDAAAALCIAETEDLETPAIRTAPFLYFRLRKDSYETARIAHWAKTIRRLAKGANEVYAFFRHNNAAPHYALALAKTLDANPPEAKGALAD